MRVHIIGAGLAGLAAAVHLTKRGASVSLYEAAPRAGGRCRSYHDSHLGCMIDNGNHLLLSGNSAAMTFLEMIGSRLELDGPTSAAYPFVDLQAGTRWTLQPSRGRIPWWILDSGRRVPGTTPSSYLSALRLLHATPTQTVADIVSLGSALYRKLWEPLTVAALNTSPDKAAAALMAPVLRESFLKGADACRPLIARNSLAAALVDPALAFLGRASAEIRLGCRVRALGIEDGRVNRLDADTGPVDLDADDAVVIAVPPWVAGTLVPGLKGPPPGEAIVNVHYRLPRPFEQVQILGLIGGLAQWLFLRGALASVTISAAGALAEEDAESIATKCWRDVALALNDPSMAEPPSRVVKEKRATFAQTPSAIALRPDTRTGFANLLLAGDWTATGLPATIEGAVRSGFTAAEAAISGRARLKAA
ncbi:MAG: hydroxysqualene dehydroxylase HpnE [Rhodospirillaceae bacterium]